MCVCLCVRSSTVHNFERNVFKLHLYAYGVNSLRQHFFLLPTSKSKMAASYVTPFRFRTLASVLLSRWISNCSCILVASSPRSSSILGILPQKQRWPPGRNVSLAEHVNASSWMTMGEYMMTVPHKPLLIRHSYFREIFPNMFIQPV